MAYPSPLAVRTVKNVLKDGMREASIYGATSVVNALVGTLWGTVLSSSHRRDYLDFIGELAGRTITPTQRKIASRYYGYNNLHSSPNSEGGATIRIPVSKDSNYYINRDGSQRQKNQDYDPVSLKDIDNIIDSRLKMYGIGKGGQQNNQPKEPQQNQPKPKDHSVLEEAVNSLCRTSMDFSIADFFRNVKAKLLSVFSRQTRQQSEEATLQGCYEFLEEQGYDGKSILTNIILNQRDGNFSEGDFLGVDDSEVEDFLRLSRTYNSLNDRDKERFIGAMNQRFGKETTNELMKGFEDSKNGSVSGAVVLFLKLVGVFMVARKVLQFIVDPPRKKPERPAL